MDDDPRSTNFPPSTASLTQRFTESVKEPLMRACPASTRGRDASSLYTRPRRASAASGVMKSPRLYSPRFSAREYTRNGSVLGQTVFEAPAA
jgi:hypothetical protein